jgi:hypothetical protein
VSGIEPWPAVLKWEELEGETDWEVQVSASSSFDSDVQVLASTGSEVQVIAPGKGFAFASHKIMQMTKANLKPTTKYYWRVHSKSAEPPKKASGLDLAPEKKRVPWLRPGRGRKAPGAGSLSGTVLVQIPSSGDYFLGGWNPWGATQEFETGAKVPEPIAPAPPPLGKKIPEIVVAPGAYYPWNAEFSWKPVSGASRYRITVSESPNRSCGPSKTQQITFPSGLQPTIESVPAPKTAGTVKKDFPLKSDHTYYWWLKVYGPGDIAGGCAYGGHPIRFKTSAPKATLKSPADGDHVSPFQTTLEWSKVDGATGYVLQWAKTSAKLSPAGEPVDSLSAVIAPGAVGPHYWRVRPKGPLSGDMGAASSTWTFVADLELTKPKLLKPDGKKWEAYGEQVAFTWDRVPGAMSYLLTIGRNANQAVGENPVQIDSGFSQGGSVANIWVEDVSTHTEGYCWTVRASGVGGMAGATSDVWCYPIGAGRVEITSPQDGALDMKYDASTVSWTCPYCPGGFKVTYEAGHSDGTCDHGLLYSKKLPSTENSHTRDDLKPATWYCVWVAGLNPDETEHGYGDSVWFRTKAKPAPCKPVAVYDISPMGPPAYAPVGQGWDRRLSWAEANPDIKEYKLFALAHGPKPLQGGSPPVYATWPSPVVSSASLDSGLKWGSAPIRVWTLPSFIPWSPTQYNVDTYQLEIAVYGRSVSEEQVCDWKEVGGFVVLVGG